MVGRGRIFAAGRRRRPPGRKYELDAGLMEISYASGAKVILQGPCRYEVDSAAGATSRWAS